ncbi:MAG TPA: helix-hairpin-helix domain-containing protein, partial [Thermoleophilia bacterium]|nr:helix-hairpin-helix domain-containing protein [Thermoleophilia bacterium]
PIDLNEAPLTQLQELPGIGPKKAEAIVALRQRRPFSRVSQLLEVRGIGKKTLERLKPLVKIGATASRSHATSPVGSAATAGANAVGPRGTGALGEARP